jgi:hypothetical protein
MRCAEVSIEFYRLNILRFYTLFSLLCRVVRYGNELSGCDRLDLVFQSLAAVGPSSKGKSLSLLNKCVKGKYENYKS